MNVRYATACSGIEAPSVAWEPLGWKPVAFSEVDPFCSKLLAERYPTVPNLKHPSGEDWFELSPADVLYSRGVSLHELNVNPRIAVWEFSPKILRSQEASFGDFLARLVGSPSELFPNEASAWAASGKPLGRGVQWPVCGIVHGRRRTVAWRSLDAQHFGVSERKPCCFVVATNSRDAIHPGAILFEPEVSRQDAWFVDAEPFSFSGCRPPVIENGEGRVRRLTPRECERLRGFPDDYTRISSHRKRKRMKPEELASFSEYSGISVDELKVFGYTPDGPRYKAIGNSMAVPVIRWIGRRIEKCMEAFG